MDVVTLGEAMIRYSPPDGETFENASVFHAYVAGAESNVAVALARLGLRVGWVSRLPNNVLGRRVAGQIRRHGVDTGALVWAPAAERVGTYYLEPGRSPRPTVALYDRAHSAFAAIQPDDIDWEYVTQAAWLHLGGITPALGPGPRHVIERAARVATEHSLTLSFDVNYRSKLWSPDEASAFLSGVLDRATIVQCSARDARLLFDAPPIGPAAAETLYDRFQADLVVVTDGADGACAYDGHLYTAPAFQADTLDPIGSGDAFAAGFIAGFRSDGVERGLRWGCALAALKRTYRGDVLWAGREELETLLDDDSVPIVR